MKNLEEKLKESIAFMNKRVLEIEAQLYRDDFDVTFSAPHNKTEALDLIRKYKRKLEILNVIEGIL